MHLVKTLLAAGLLLSATAQAQNVLDFPQPKNNPEEFYAVTEIPAGGIIKYETDAKTGFLIADRFQSMPVAYPANYGSLTQSLAGDGDPLDVVFYTRAPMAPGTLIKLRAIGVLKMIDGGEKDDKIIAVPASKIDPTYDDINTIGDLPKIEQERLQAFFRVYKQLPEGRKKVELNGFNDAAAAKQEIKAAWDAWKEKIRNKRKNRHRPVPAAFSSPYFPQSEAIRGTTPEPPKFPLPCFLFFSPSVATMRSKLLFSRVISPSQSHC